MRYSRYSLAAIGLHWIIALSLAFQIALGWQFENLEQGKNLFGLYQLHKSVGITILVLSILRLIIRFGRQRPAAFRDGVWPERISRLVHAAFYVVMIGGPVSGWILVSTSKIVLPTYLFDVVPLPHLPVDKSLHGPAEVIHEYLAWIAVGLFFLHVAGALRHQFFKNENIMSRMIPWATRRKLPVLITTASVLLAMGFAYREGATINFSATPGAAPQEIVMASQNPAQRGGSIPLKTTPLPDVSPAPVATAEDSTAARKLEKWRVSKGGKLGFTANWNGTPVHGSFSRWNSDIRFSPDDLDNSVIRVSVDLGSVGTADTQRDEMLLGEGFFNVAMRPKAEFSSSSITRVRDNRYRAFGKLDLNGRVRPITLEFQLRIDGSNAAVSGSVRLQRTTFGIGSGEWAETDEIADKVAVSFAFAATAVP